MNMSLRRRPRGCATPVVMAGAALALTGCTDSVPVQRDTPIYTITVPDRWPYRDNGTYAPPVAYPRPAPAPPPSYSFIPRAEARRQRRSNTAAAAPGRSAIFDSGRFFLRLVAALQSVERVMSDDVMRRAALARGDCPRAGAA